MKAVKIKNVFFGDHEMMIPIKNEKLHYQINYKKNDGEAAKNFDEDKSNSSTKKSKSKK